MTGFGFSNGPTAVPVFIIIVAVLVFGGILYAIGKGISTKVKNDNSPILVADAVIVGRRTEVSGMDRAYTSYYVTFQLENGERLELSLKGKEYGMLAENDKGKLTYQGTRYLGFVRE